MGGENTNAEIMNEPQSFRVVAVEFDDRIRTRLAVQLAGRSVVTYESIDSMLEAVPEGQGVVAVFGPGLANDTGLAQAQRLTRIHPEIGVVLLVPELSLTLLQQALRAGVRDALVESCDDALLRQSVDRVGEAMVALAARSVPMAPVQELGRVIVAFSTKGGVGKSVVATNTAVALASRGRGRVAIVDADLQFGDVAVLLGVPPVHTTAEAAASLHTADAQLMEGLLGTHEASGLRVLPAPVEPSAGDRISPEEMIGIIDLLRTMFSYVVVDMPPHFDDVVLALLEAADDVLVIASMDIPSIKNLKVGIQTLDLLAIAGSKMRLVLNRANAKVNLEVADVERALGVPAEFRIPSDISVPQAVNRGVPVVLDRPRSAAALALSSLVDVLTGTVAEDDEAAEGDARRRGGWRRSD